jgi:hypothetical protein
MRPGGGRGHGVTALFAGDSGTGKTMSAEVIAGALGLDLYVVDLATVVDKYVGETEKNLERIFAEASGVNAVLLFDEADAVFGKRSEVRDAHDRYANIESAYLLQRMETFDGLAILATNLRANIDEAFTRPARLHRRLPGADRGAAPLALEGEPVAAAAGGGRHRLRLPREGVRVHRRQRALGRDERRVPGGRGRPAGRDDGGHRRRRAGVPQARPAGARARVRRYSRDAPLTRFRLRSGFADYHRRRERAFSARGEEWATGSVSTSAPRTTAAAVLADGAPGGPEMLPLGNRAMQVPSVLFVRDDGEVLVGEAAERRGVTEPARVVREFKRRVGDPVPLVVGGTPYSPQALVGRLLAWVVGVATERRGEPPAHVTVTYPANWGPFKRDLLGQAIAMADLVGAEVCTEPEAAAITFAWRNRVAEGERVGGLRPRRRHVRRRRPRAAVRGVRPGRPAEGGRAPRRHRLRRGRLPPRHQLAPGVRRGAGRRRPLDDRRARPLRRDCVEAKEALSATPRR